MKDRGADYSADLGLQRAIYAINKSVGMSEINFFSLLGWAVKFDAVFKLLSQACRSGLSPLVLSRTGDL